eukprot:SM000013S26493  [mRNA]  locus=s13:721894:723143:+ [translate_table: standard]
MHALPFSSVLHRAAIVATTAAATFAPSRSAAWALHRPVQLPRVLRARPLTTLTMMSDPATAAAATEAREGDKPKLFCAWFCPFAQRAWIALEEKGVPYEYLEVDPYAKPPELMAVNPRGLVPSLEHRDHGLYESMVLMEYIDEAFEGRRLLPHEPFSRAVARIWMDYVNKKVVPTFYRFLQFQDAEKQAEAGRELLQHYKELSAAMLELDPEGPYFMGKDFTLADVVLTPWAVRDHVLMHYRGFRVPETTEFQRFNLWLAAVKERPSVRATLADPERLQATYQRYADNTVQSEVGRAINSDRPLP